MPPVNKTRTIAEIRESCESLENQLNAIISTAETEARDFAVEEATQVTTLTRQIAEEHSLIEAMQAVEQVRLNQAEQQRRRDRAAIPQRDNVEFQARKFSWTKFIRGCYEDKHEGLEAEMREEGLIQVKGHSHTAKVRNPLPADFFKPVTRDQDASTPTKGKETIDTQLGGLIPALRPNLVLTSQLGARMMTGLTQPWEFPRQTSLMSAAWKAEKIAATETDADFDKISLSPKRLAAWSEFTKDILFQSDLAIDAFVKSELESAIRTKLDLDLIAAASGGDAPTGLLNITGTNDASIGGSGAKLDWADLVNFYKLMTIENADMGNMAFYSNPLVAYDLMTTEKTSGTTGQMLLEKIGGSLAGFPAYFSNQVPSDLTDTSYEDQSAMIFGNWSDFIIAQFSGFDVIVDPYTKGKEAMVQIITHSWWDCDVRHPESFSIAKDIGGTVVAG